MLPAFRISSLEVVETVLLEIFVLTNEVSTLFHQDVQVFPSLYRFSLILFDHRQRCKPKMKTSYFRINPNG
jgi:glutathionyl-hydroquinone reductase